jgi:RNA polymerase sigma-70 factor (ECF subfamily)
MKFSYNFATGEKNEIEVSEEFYAVIMELERETYNINQRETRRHCSLEAYNLDDALFPSDVDVEAEVCREETRAEVEAAIDKLPPEQQRLIRTICLDGVPAVEYAQITGDSPSNISHKLSRAKKALKKILS